MQKPRVTPDDLMDIVELADQLQQEISKTLDDKDFNIAMSALIGATINAMIAQCSSVQQAFNYRNIFFNLFTAILNKKIKEGNE